MSNIYISEPSTNGKVVLKTTVGELEIELWSREAPKACRNFVQLCMEGYYDGTLFHRVVKNFLIQGGDPTGTGDGGESIYGQPFKTEIHSRLRFTRRGLLAMSCPEADKNSSQFFFTLAAAPELEKKHTIFGKVVGDTIYNLIKLNECETDNDDRPLNPQRILSTQIIFNPFPDIVPRERIRHEVPSDDEESRKPQSKCVATKNFSLLSFAEEVEEEDVTFKPTRESYSSRTKSGKSAHDLLNDPSYCKPEVEEDDFDDLENPTPVDHDKDGDYNDDDSRTKEERMNELRKKLVINDKDKKKSKAHHADIDEETPTNRASPDYDFDEKSRAEEKRRKRDELRRESEKLRLEILASKHRSELEEIKRLQEEKERNAARDHLLHSGNEVLDELHAEQQQYRIKHVPEVEKTNKKDSKRSDAEKNHEAYTAKFFSRFTQRLHKVVSGEQVKDESFQEFAEKLDMDEEVRPVVLDANVFNPDRYSIDDPRHPINQRKRKRQPGEGNFKEKKRLNDLE